MEKHFHIHIDTQSEATEVHQAAQDQLGFYAHNFSGHPDGYPHFEPTQHSSFKTENASRFQATWKALEALMQKYPRVKGYIEGEYIPFDEAIEERPVTDFVRPSIQITRRRLDATLGEAFRETEVHIVMDFDQSDRRVINGLLDSGFYGALLEKKDHRAIVLTMQGTRRLITPLIAATRSYLDSVGGVVRGSIKEERAIRHCLYNMKAEELPEVAERVSYEKSI